MAGTLKRVGLEPLTPNRNSFMEALFCATGHVLHFTDEISSSSDRAGSQSCDKGLEAGWSSSVCLPLPSPNPDSPAPGLIPSGTARLRWTVLSPSEPMQMTPSSAEKEVLIDPESSCQHAVPLYKLGKGCPFFRTLYCHLLEKYCSQYAFL